jgi:protein-disulfide isomerase
VKVVLLNRITLVLGFLGIFIAGYLTLSHQLRADVPCGPSGGCDKVLSHPAAMLGTIPVAAVGLFGYLLITGLAVARAATGVTRIPKLAVFGFVISAIGAAASLYYQFVALTVIRQRCDWCLASAIVMVIAFIVHGLLAQSVEASKEEAPGGSDFFLTSGIAGLTIVALAISGFQMAQFSTPLPSNLDQSKPLVPDQANVLGSPDARITIVEFADMYCPACRASGPRVKEIVKQNPEKIRLVFRHWPLVQQHPLAVNSALVAEMAADEKRFWEYLTAVMESETPPEDAEDLIAIASTLGMDAAKIRERLNNESDPAYTRVARDMRAADELGLQFTPTFFLQIDGKTVSVASSRDIFDKLNEPRFQEILKAPAAANAPAQ